MYCACSDSTAEKKLNMREGEWQGDCDHRGDKLCGLGRGEGGGHGQSVRTHGQGVALKSGILLSVSVTPRLS